MIEILVLLALAGDPLCPEVERCTTDIECEIAWEECYDD